MRVYRRRRPRPRGMQPAVQFMLQLKAENIHFEAEHKFHPKRKWRADFIIPTAPNILVEIEGGAYIGGRHVRGKGFEADIEKYNEAALMGFKLLRGTTKHVRNGYLIDCVKRALGY